MVDGKVLTEKLLRYAETFLHLDKRDEMYMRNLLLREFGEDFPAEAQEVGDLSYIDSLTVPDSLVEEIETLGIERGKCEDVLKNLYSTYIMGLLSPMPSEVNRCFLKLKEEKGIEAACKYFFDLSIMNNYVQKTAIARNLKWEFKDGNKFLEITVNLSKPEKNNKDIAKLLSMPKADKKYPACLLCKENEGFKGTATHPARENIRIIPLKMGGQDWFVQYSPYAYYNEHMIAINTEHVPMRIDRSTVSKILDFVDFFPNYMIGSNAALPIVGGSILNHEHYQGGEHLMPMHYAPIKQEFISKNYPDVKVAIVDWYNSVIRLESSNRENIAKLTGDIIESWENYTDEDCFIYAKTEGVPHNTLSPVARKKGETYIIDIILRNNITTKQYPDGVFHAHPEYHNIKKEGIGLIEAMGLFVLPGRLKRQLAMIADLLCGREVYKPNEIAKEDHYLNTHIDMIKSLMKEGKCATYEEAEAKVTDRVNNVCKNILYNTAVFKPDQEGYEGFKRFLSVNKIVLDI